MNELFVSRTASLINFSTMEYPVSVYQLRQRFNRITFPANIPLDYLHALGYAEVLPVEVPVGDVVAEGVPELRDGKWYKTYTVRSFTPEELAKRLSNEKIRRTTAVMDLRDREAALGVPFNLNDVIYHVQIRNQDITNLITVRMEAEGCIKNGQMTMMNFRPYENVTLVVTPQEAYDITNVALVVGRMLYKNSWDIKDQITAATTLEELPEVPATLMPNLE